MPMTNSGDDILARELAKVATLGGALPGAAASGAALGAKLAAKVLPTETHTEKLALKITPEKALKLCFSVLTKLGKLQTEMDSERPYPMLKAVVGSGFLKMNPAIVYLKILEDDSKGCEASSNSTRHLRLWNEWCQASEGSRIGPKPRGHSEHLTPALLHIPVFGRGLAGTLGVCSHVI
jgi:hypothetical protein